MRLGAITYIPRREITAALLAAECPSRSHEARHTKTKEKNALPQTWRIISVKSILLGSSSARLCISMAGCHRRLASTGSKAESHSENRRGVTYS